VLALVTVKRCFRRVSKSFFLRNKDIIRNRKRDGRSKEGDQTLLFDDEEVRLVRTSSVIVKRRTGEETEQDGRKEDTTTIGIRKVLLHMKEKMKRRQRSGKINRKKDTKPLAFVTIKRCSRGMPLSLIASPNSSCRYHSRAVAVSNNLGKNFLG
jgi:hypothetical protein